MAVRSGVSRVVGSVKSTLRRGRSPTRPPIRRRSLCAGSPAPEDSRGGGIRHRSKLCFRYAVASSRGAALSLRMTGNRLGQVFIPAAAGVMLSSTGIGAAFVTTGALLSAAAASTWRAHPDTAAPRTRIEKDWASTTQPFPRSKSRLSTSTPNARSVRRCSLFPAQ